MTKSRYSNLFTCRVCKAHDFSAVKEPTNFVGKQHRNTAHYICSICTVHFDDPQKFSLSPFNYNQFLDDQTEAMLAKELDGIAGPTPV
jgi:transcription elongation factor Elf1